MSSTIEKDAKVRVLLEYTKGIKLEVLKSAFEVSRVKGARQHLNYRFTPKQKQIGEGIYELGVDIGLGENSTLRIRYASDKSYSPGSQQECCYWTILDCVKICTLSRHIKL